MTTNNIEYVRTEISVNIVPDLDFFGDGKAKSKRRRKFTLPRLRDLYPDEFQSYIELFIVRCDTRAFNTKLGYWAEPIPISQQYPPAMSHSWQPLRMKGGKYVPAYSDTLASHAERHLDPAYWRLRGHSAKGHQQPFWLGTLGCQSSKSFAYDVDNHGGNLILYTKDGGNYMVPDLHLSTLDTLFAVLGFPYEDYQLPRPTVLSVSSDSLGLNVWLLPETYAYTKDFEPRMSRMADEHGLPGLEYYPQQPLAGQTPHKRRNVHRRPCGQGTSCLTHGGIITGWREQLAVFLDPVPLPSMAQVVEQLLELWRLAHLRWRPDFLVEPSERLDFFNARCQELRGWSPSRLATKDSEPRIQVAPQPTRLPATPEIASTPSGPTQVVSLPMGWDKLTYPERLYRLAVGGCPGQGLLHWSTIQLARHLMTYELVRLDQEEREELSFQVVSRWILDKHNGCSRRISHGDSELPQEIEREIWRDIKKVGEVTSNNRTNLRLRSLITGEGEPNGYAEATLPIEQTADTEELYCVRHSTKHDELTEKKLSDDATERIRQSAGRKPGKSIEFLTKLANILDKRGGQSRLNREYYMPVLLGYSSTSVWDKFMKVGKLAGLIEMTDGHHKGLKSNEYKLLVQLEDNQPEGK